MIYARIAAVTYVAWGVLHLVAAYDVYQLGTTLDAGVLQGRIYQDAWNLNFFALFGAVVGIVFIWRNTRLGYLLNAVVVSAGDIGFIVTLLIPGTSSTGPRCPWSGALDHRTCALDHRVETRAAFETSTYIGAIK